MDQMVRMDVIEHLDLQNEHTEEEFWRSGPTGLDAEESYLDQLDHLDRLKPTGEAGYTGQTGDTGDTFWEPNLPF